MEHINMNKVLPPVVAKKPIKSPSGKMDDYEWLRSEKWQQVMKDPSVLESDIRAVIEGENTYADFVLSGTKDIQEILFNEIKGRIKEDDQSLPSPDGIYEYYSRFEIGGQYPISCRKLRNNETASEEILFHLNNMAKGFDYFGVGGISRSHSHKIMAYALDTKGSEYYTVRFRYTDMESDLNQTELNDVLENTTGGIVWSTNDDYVFYVTLDESHRSNKVWRHKMGTAQSDDIQVYEELDTGFFVGISMSESEEYIFIDAHDHISSETYFIKADAPLSDFSVIAERVPNVEYDVSHHGEYFYISTNKDDAIDFKIMRVAVTNPSVENWVDYIPHCAGILQSGMSVCAKYMLRMEKENALPRIMIRDMETQEEKSISFEEEAYSLGLSGALEFDENIMRFSYSSPTTQNEIYDYDMETGERTLRKRQIIPSGHEPSQYETKRIYATSHDGVKIPLTIVYKKGIVLDGSNPCLLYGYGSYGHSMPAGFSSTRLSLLDRGFVYATAHIRGGMDCGYDWYNTGKLMHKKNTFEDFIACGNALIEHGYTKLGGITAMGGSAGGMLMGAVVNMRADMFKSIVAMVPFVDVLNTICDATLPLTPPEWNEWGNPLESQDVYDYMESYSPYDNVKAGAYPHMYVQAGLTDPRVTYWEPAKWVAKVRDHKTNTDDTMLVLRTQMGAGHGGASGRFDSLKETAEEFAFILKSHGIV